MQSVRSEIIRIVWPSFMELFLTSLAAMVDMMMVGKLGSWAIAGVGLTNQPKQMMMATFVALNSGATALVARFRGSGEREEANLVMRQALVLTLVLSLLVGALTFLGSGWLMTFMGAKEEATLKGGTQYLQIQALGFVFMAMTMAITAVLRGVGETRAPMVYNMISNVVNIFLNYCLINGRFGFPRLEVAGASLATVIGQFVAFCIALIILLRGTNFLHLRLRDGFMPNMEMIRRITRIGVPAIFEQLIMRVGLVLFTRTVASLGTVAYATHQICLNLQQLSLMNGQSFGIAATALLGRSLGAGRADHAKVYVARTRRYGLYLSLLIALLFMTSGRFLFLLYNTTEPELIRMGRPILWMMALLQPLQSSQMILNGALRGAGDTRSTAFVMFFGTLIVRPACAWLFISVLYWGLIGGWLAMLCDQALRSVLSLMRFESGRWMRIKV